MAASSNSSLSGSSVSSGKFRQRCLPSFHFYLSAARRPARPGLRRDAPPCSPRSSCGGGGARLAPPSNLFPPAFVWGQRGGCQPPPRQGTGRALRLPRARFGGQWVAGEHSGTASPACTPPGHSAPLAGHCHWGCPWPGVAAPRAFRTTLKYPQLVPG